MVTVAWTGMVVTVSERSGLRSDIFWRLGQLGLLRDRMWVWSYWQDGALLLTNGIICDGDFMKYSWVYLLKMKSPWP